MRPTLSVMNAAPREWEWSGVYRLRDERAIGRAGRKGRGREIHVLHVDRIVMTLPMAHGKGKVGDVFAVHAACGTRSNGQVTGRVLNVDTDAVTCERCLKRFGWEARP
jgi:hypothetical protein